MPKAFDGTIVPETLETMPCGGTPQWDYGSEMSYRCNICNATIGSIAMPGHCKDALDEKRNRELVIKTIGFKDNELD